MAPYRDNKIRQPAIFIGGTREGSRFMNGYHRFADADWLYADSRGVKFIEVPDTGSSARRRRS